MRLLEALKNGETYIVAEMSANHAGSLDDALEIVVEAKRAGADCLKIQTYTADTLTIECKSDYFKIKGGLWESEYLYNLYRQAETPWEWQKRIKEKCDDMGIDFLSTPFDKTSVDFLCEIGVAAIKISSFEIVDIPLLSYAASKGKTMIISCGMASLEEINEAITACTKEGNKNIILMKCCSEYPASLENMNLSTITDMMTRFNLPIGISDHSLGFTAAIVACSLGACIIEKHFRLENKKETPDSDFSMSPVAFSEMVKQVRMVERSKGKVFYGVSQGEEESIVFRRSIFAVGNISKGDLFSEENVRIIRPGYGLKAKHYTDLIGRRSPRDICFGEPITLSDMG